ncbi:GFA family protein [Rhodobacterales bacterium HKCCE2091]|nr:GFA family protein [Rhodobacterales bacterium HKCCE2091]
MLTGTCHCHATTWRLDALPDSATACNCSICARYGALWAYGWLGEDLHLTGETRRYRRADSGDIDFHHCPSCGCVTAWTGARPHPDGRTRAAVNLRMTDPGPILDVPIRHFEGLDSFTALPPDHRTIREMWS